MKRITGQAAYCRERAAICRELAGLRNANRALLFEMEARWLALAESYDLAEKVSGWIAWQAQNVAPPPNA